MPLFVKLVTLIDLLSICGVTSAGDKLRIAGAEISAGGAQMEALEAAKSTFLRIHFNGTHRWTCLVTSSSMASQTSRIILDSVFA